jgi:putative transposase
MQRRLRTTGHFFERRYHATLVDADAYLLELLRYIHLNPVRAGLVDEPGGYPWSSHHNYVMSRRDSWVTTDFCMSLFGDDRVRASAAYRAFVACTDEAPWESALNQGSRSLAVLGGDEFIVQAMRAPRTSLGHASLGELVAEACRRFEVEPARLISPARDAYVAKVRAWIAHQAFKRGIGTRSAVARALGRSEATLRYAIKAYPGELE